LKIDETVAIRSDVTSRLLNLVVDE